MLFSRKIDPTPSERLTLALAGLTAANDAVNAAAEDLENQKALLAGELRTVSANANRANVVAANLAKLLGDWQ